MERLALTYYDPPPKVTKMVLEGYPTGFLMDHLENHPLVESATRLRVRISKEETRQVLVTLRGEPPSELHSGIFGVFTLREYYREPLRCTKFKCFNHHVTNADPNPIAVSALRNTSSMCAFKRIKMEQSRQLNAPTVV